MLNGYSELCLRIPDSFRRASSCFFPGAKMWVASFKLDSDVGELFPYINAVVEGALYYEKPHHIQFIFDGCCCSLYPERASVRFFEDREQAVRYTNRLIDFLNDLHSRTDSLTPNHETYEFLPVLKVLGLLPRTNCRECGFPTCLAFAVALSKGKTVPEKCPDFENPIRETAMYPVYDKGGCVVSTITIGIDTSQMRLDLERYKKYIASLEKSPARIAQENCKSLPESDRSRREFGLSEREIEVLKLVAKGLTNTEISQSLCISPHTVKSHIIHIFNKLGVNDRTHAAVLATRFRLI